LPIGIVGRLSPQRWDFSIGRHIAKRCGKRRKVVAAIRISESGFAPHRCNTATLPARRDHIERTGVVGRKPARMGVERSLVSRLDGLSRRAPQDGFRCQWNMRCVVVNASTQNRIVD
jgi:hypothetical protein